MCLNVCLGFSWASLYKLLSDAIIQQCFMTYLQGRQSTNCVPNIKCCIESSVDNILNQISRIWQFCNILSTHLEAVW